MAGEDDPHTTPSERRFEREVARKAERRQRAARETRGVWFSLGLFGLVGWSVAIPALLGIALGAWIDNRWPGRISWTITLLFVGLAVGCFNAWRWITQEGRDDRP